jgi:hypothetical protein
MSIMAWVYLCDMSNPLPIRFIGSNWTCPYLTIWWWHMLLRKNVMFLCNNFKAYKHGFTLETIQRTDWQSWASTWRICQLKVKTYLKIICFALDTHGENTLGNMICTNYIEILMSLNIELASPCCSWAKSSFFFQNLGIMLWGWGSYSGKWYFKSYNYRHLWGANVSLMSKYLVTLSYYPYYNLETNDLICGYLFIWRTWCMWKEFPYEVEWLKWRDPMIFMNLLGLPTHSTTC